MPGVIRTRVGYAGGTKENPTYYNLGNHSETIQIDYDPALISYEELLQIFWDSHNPQHGAVSQQYRSIIFYHDPQQQESAQESKAAYEAQVGAAVETAVMPYDAFYAAEDYHQKYNLQQDKQLMAVLLEAYPDFQDFIDSTAAARLNGYSSIYLSYGELISASEGFDLPPETIQQLLEAAKP